MLNRNMIRKLVEAQGLLFSIPAGRFVVGSGAALVMHGLREETMDVDIDLDHDEFKTFIDGKGSFGSHTGIMGDSVYRMGVYASIHYREWNGDNTEVINGVRVYTLARLLEQYETLSQHPDRGEKAKKDLENIALIQNHLSEKKHVFEVTDTNQAREGIAHVAMTVACTLLPSMKFIKECGLNRIQHIADAHDRYWYVEQLESGAVQFARSRFERVGQPFQNSELILRYKHLEADLVFQIAALK